MRNYKGLKGILKRHSYEYTECEEIDPSVSVYVYWWRGKINIGDLLNKFIIEKLSNKEVKWVPRNCNKEHYLVIGSILQTSNDNSVVWGTGMIYDQETPLFKPKKVHAVRGPKTREILLARGIKCPQVYGDPALLLPMFIQPKVNNKRYRLGVIPHYKNKQHPFFLQSLPSDVKIIDVETDDIQKFVDDINCCEMIVSSSLHGIIIADAYGIPAHHVKFDESVVGGNFKFHDYYLSVKRDCVEPVTITEKTQVDSLFNLPKRYNLEIDTGPLLASCPFLAHF